MYLSIRRKPCSRSRATAATVSVSGFPSAVRRRSRGRQTLPRRSSPLAQPAGAPRDKPRTSPGNPFGARWPSVPCERGRTGDRVYRVPPPGSLVVAIPLDLLVARLTETSSASGSWPHRTRVCRGLRMRPASGLLSCLGRSGRPLLPAADKPAGCRGGIVTVEGGTESTTALGRGGPSTAWRHAAFIPVPYTLRRSRGAGGHTAGVVHLLGRLLDPAGWRPPGSASPPRPDARCLCHLPAGNVAQATSGKMGASIKA